MFSAILVIRYSRGLSYRLLIPARVTHTATSPADHPRHWQHHLQWSPWQGIRWVKWSCPHASPLCHVLSWVLFQLCHPNFMPGNKGIYSCLGSNFSAPKSVLYSLPGDPIAQRPPKHLVSRVSLCCLQILNNHCHHHQRDQINRTQTTTLFAFFRLSVSYCLAVSLNSLVKEKQHTSLSFVFLLWSKWCGAHWSQRPCWTLLGQQAAAMPIQKGLLFLMLKHKAPVCSNTSILEKSGVPPKTTENYMCHHMRGKHLNLRWLSQKKSRLL